MAATQWKGALADKPPVAPGTTRQDAAAKAAG